MDNEHTPNLSPMFVTISQTALDARLLAMELIKMQKGEVMTYVYMSSIIGKDILNHRYIILRAVSMAKKEVQKVYRAVRKVGYKCLEDPEFITVGEKNRQKTLRQNRRTLDDLNCVDYSNLDQNQTMQILAAQSIAGATVALHHMTSLKRVQAVIAAQETPVKLDIHIVKKLLE